MVTAKDVKKLPPKERKAFLKWVNKFLRRKYNELCTNPHNNRPDIWNLQKGIAIQEPPFE